MKKILKIQLEVNGGDAKLNIIEQSHRTAEFGSKKFGQHNVTGDRFKASNGMYLVSASTPAESGETQFFVRGTNTREDDKAVSVSAYILPNLLQAIAEYNAFDFDFDDGKTELEEAIEAFGEHADPLRKLLKHLKMPTK